MKNLKVVDLSKYSPAVAKEIADSMGVKVASGFVYVDKTSAKLIEKMLKNRVAKAGKEEREQDVLIILSGHNHQSLMNYPIYMNNREFLLNAVKLTPNPRACKNYFYQYINKNLKKDKVFNFQFLNNIIFNFGITEAKFVANQFGLNGVLSEIIADNEFRALNSSPSGCLAKIDY